MAFIIPDKLLETLICDSCHKYLSVKPIKVFPNRRIKCGRCCQSKNQSDGVVSLYGVVVDKCLFKCINRFDGCRTLLTYSEVKNHEKTCLSKHYKCPVCPESLEIQTFLMGKHFRENHKSLLLDNSGFSLNLDTPVESPVIYFYQQSDGLFFLFVNINQVDKKVELSFFYLGDSSEAKTIYQQFTVHNSNDLEIKLKPKPCYAYLSTDCDYISVNLPNTTCIVFIKFSIIFKDEKLIKISKGLSLSSIRVPKKTYFPMVKKHEPLLIYNHASLEKQLSNITSISRIATFGKITKQIRNCLNCLNICCNFYDNSGFHYFYWNSKLNYSLCYYCFHFLNNMKEIKLSDYVCVKLDKSFLERIQIECKNCQKPVNIGSYWEHMDYCDLQYLNVCPMLDCNFVGKFEKINAHLKIHQSCCEILSCSNVYLTYIILNVNSKNYFYFDEGFVSLNVVKNNSKLNLKIQMVPSVKGNRNHEKWKPVALLFDQRDQFLTSFEDSLTTSCPDKHYKVKVIVTKVQS